MMTFDASMFVEFLLVHDNANEKLTFYDVFVARHVFHNMWLVENEKNTWCELL